MFHIYSECVFREVAGAETGRMTKSWLTLAYKNQKIRGQQRLKRTKAFSDAFAGLDVVDEDVLE
jgi:hypothetical protein